MPISIIMPTLNEAGSVSDTLKSLQLLRLYGGEIIVADGGSIDGTKQACEKLVDHWVDAEQGRANQMNAGASVASHPILLFLHADTVLPNNFINLLKAFSESPAIWGRFNVRLSGHHKMFRVIEFMMNWRSRLTGISTGDQAIFVRKTSFEQVGGFPSQPLMEDIELSGKLKRLSKPYCIATPLITDSRRWEKYGVWRTVFLMWSLRLRYFFGESADRIASKYQD